MLRRNMRKVRPVYPTVEVQPGQVIVDVITHRETVVEAVDDRWYYTTVNGHKGATARLLLNENVAQGIWVIR